MGRDFYAVLDQVLALLRSRGRVTYNSWFTEGFDTVDLQEARALREELAG